MLLKISVQDLDVQNCSNIEPDEPVCNILVKPSLENLTSLSLSISCRKGCFENFNKTNEEFYKKGK